MIATNPHSPVKDIHKLQYECSLSEVSYYLEFIQIRESEDVAQYLDEEIKIKQSSSRS